MNFLDLIANDPNVAPAFRRIFANPEPCVLTTAVAKAEPRRFTGEPNTAFGDLDGIGKVGSLRWREVNDQEGADAIWDCAHQEQIERDEAAP